MKNKNLCFPVVGMNAEPEKANFLRQLMKDVIAGHVKHIDIKIEPEPSNPFDAGAIAVLLNGTKIGFIGRENQVYFNFTYTGSYAAQITHWGVTQNDEAVFIYIQPYL